MNYTQNNLNFKTFLALLLVVLFTSETIFAKMAADMFLAPPMQQQAFQVSEVISFYTKKQNTEKLSDNEANILKLSLLAQDVFEVKDFKIPAHLKTDKEKAITLNHVTTVIQQAIEKKSNWDEPLSNSNLEKIKDSSELLKKILNESSYSWAWISYQMGQKQEAKKILIEKFETTYAQVMKLKHVLSHRSSPMAEGERLAKTLKPMSTDDENNAREDHLKKMRTHISTLPDVQIMT